MAKDTRARITEIQKELDGVDERLKKIQEITDLAESRFTQIGVNKTEALALKVAIAGVKDEVDDILLDIEETQTKASEFEQSIEGLVEGAQSSKETFEEHVKNLNDVEEKIKKFEEAITIQLGRAGAGALAKSFDLRQIEIEKELKRWRDILYGSTVALVLLSVIFFIYSFHITEWSLGLFLKISISLPLIYIVWFASKQYAKERFILERYAFKVAQAKSLDAFSKTVKEMDTSEKGQSRAQEFVINSVGKIYVAPKLQGEDPEFPVMKSIETVKNLTKN